ncbi:hypothetical protein DFJ43DRAFT_1141427 [Lentinula guzmanii]|uniref:Uncharacterized protein n=1 Tax=Lentinula guzmanii TaxID=2804957 RepID=A0AA38MWH4_9AGAR|nr:hypothetical protein DFJ43DRAFT_1141427 [Lentinula guzmanii]
MHLRANTFLPTLFVSLLCVASTFAIPISPDSDSHNFPSDTQSPKLVDRDVVPQLIDARAANVVETHPHELEKWPLEAHVFVQCCRLPVEDQDVLKSAIEMMLKPMVSKLRSYAQKELKEELAPWNVNNFPKVDAVPVTAIDYPSSSQVDSTSNTDYILQFNFVGKLDVSGGMIYHIRGFRFYGTIARASLSNGGKELTGSISEINPQTNKTNVLVSFTKGKQNRVSDVLGRLGFTSSSSARRYTRNSLSPPSTIGKVRRAD